MSMKDKNNNMEFDDMNIRSHLNTSLDLSGISVSEDLINRTLEAIKKQPLAENSNITAEDPESNKVEKKVIHWNRYIRGIAGIAAAGLVIFVGINLMNNVKTKSNTETPRYESAQDSTMEAPESTAKEYTALKENDVLASPAAQSNDAASSDTTATEFSTTDNGTASSADQVQTDAADQSIADTTGTTDSGLGSVMLASMPALSFKEISQLDPKQLEAVTLTNQEKGTTVSLNDQVKILDFYSLMDKYTFTESKETSANQYYTIDLKKSEQGDASYSILVGEYITVRVTEGDTITNTTYSPSDYEVFKADLDQFFNSYSK